MAKAPEHLVDAEREKLDRLRRELEAAVSACAPRTERYLLSLELFGMRFGLDRMRRLMTVLGSPQERYETIHVVGTNGKSSTARMTAAILRRHGLRTGTYLSPHLVVVHRARARRRRRTSRPSASPRPSSAPRTRPRWSTARWGPTTASRSSRRSRRPPSTSWRAPGCEVAVIEAGLGGRYDATNVIPSRVQVLTNVGLEHTRWLGPTVADIAREKLDVVQPAATLVVGATCTPTRWRSRARVAPSAVRGWSWRPADPARRSLRPRRLPAAQLRARARGRRGLPRARSTRTPCTPRRPRRWSPAASRSSTHEPDTVARRRAQPGRHGRAGRGAARLPRRPPPGGVLSILDDKDAAGDAARAAAAAATRSSAPQRQPARAAAGDAAVAVRPARRPAGPHASSATRAARWRGRASSPGPDGVALATGSIYLIADLLRPAARRPAASTL